MRSLWNLLTRKQAEQDLDEGLRFHVEGKTADGVAPGLSEALAAVAALSCAIPAMRASRIDPHQSLRVE